MALACQQQSPRPPSESTVPNREPQRARLGDTRANLTKLLACRPGSFLGHPIAPVGAKSTRSGISNPQGGDHLLPFSVAPEPLHTCSRTHSKALQVVP